MTAPLRFDVRATDGRLLDSFTEDELAVVQSGHPEKSWHEAACWAALAIQSDRQRREGGTMGTTVAEEVMTVPLDLIDVEQENNPRSEVGDVAGLAQSIDLVGLQSALTIRAGDDGRYVLVAGHRRLAALRQLGRTDAPAVVRASNGLTLAAATAENVARVDLNPIEEARAFQAMIGGGMTEKGVAEATGQTDRFVRERIRLLELPAAGQVLVAEGTLPLNAAPNLLALTGKVPAPLADLICASIQEGKVRVGQVVEDPIRVLTGVVQAAETVQVVACTAPGCEQGYVYGEEAPEHPGEDADDEAWDAFDNYEAPVCERCQGSGRDPEQPEWVAPDWICLGRSGLSFEEYWYDEATLAKLAELKAQAAWGQPASFTDETMEQAVAGGFGFLITVTAGGRSSEYRFVTDVAFAREHIVSDYAKWVERNKRGPGGPARSASGPGEPVVKRPVSPDWIGGEKLEPEPDETQAGYGKRARATARKANAALGERCFAKLDEVPVTKDAVLLLAATVLKMLDSPAMYLQLLHPDWQQVEVAKSGNEKVTYPAEAEAEALMWKWLARAETAEQVLGRLVQVLVAVRYAEQKEMPQAKRRFDHRFPAGRYGDEAGKGVPDVGKLLAKVARAGIGRAQATRNH